MLDRTERQKEAIQKWINNKCRGTFSFCTGFGKSYTTIMAIQRFFDKNPTKRPSRKINKPNTIKE